MNREQEQAYRQDLEALIPHLRAFAHSLCGNRSGADDLAQEALLKAWKARETYKIGTSLKAWTFTILRNHFYSEKRRSWRQAEWDQDKAERTLTAASNLDTTLEMVELRKALATLPEEQREAVILVGAGGFTYEETAEICGCAVGTVKSRVSRARKTLEGLMEDGNLTDQPEAGIDVMNAAQTLIDDAEKIAKHAETNRSRQTGKKPEPGKRHVA